MTDTRRILLQNHSFYSNTFRLANLLLTTPNLPALDIFAFKVITTYTWAIRHRYFRLTAESEASFMPYLLALTNNKLRVLTVVM